MEIKNYVETILKPKIQGDGGWIEYVSFEGDTLSVIFRGECSKCSILGRCKDWIVGQIEKDLGMKVKLNGVSIKPYFEDK